MRARQPVTVYSLPPREDLVALPSPAALACLGLTSLLQAGAELKHPRLPAQAVQGVSMPSWEGQGGREMAGLPWDPSPAASCAWAKFPAVALALTASELTCPTRQPGWIHSWLWGVGSCWVSTWQRLHQRPLGPQHQKLEEGGLRQPWVGCGRLDLTQLSSLICSVPAATRERVGEEMDGPKEGRRA